MAPGEGGSSRHTRSPESEHSQMYTSLKEPAWPAAQGWFRCLQGCRQAVIPGLSWLQVQSAAEFHLVSGRGSARLDSTLAVDAAASKQDGLITHGGEAVPRPGAGHLAGARRRGP